MCCRLKRAWKAASKLARPSPVLVSCLTFTKHCSTALECHRGAGGLFGGRCLLEQKVVSDGACLFVALRFGLFLNAFAFFSARVVHSVVRAV